MRRTSDTNHLVIDFTGCDHTAIIDKVNHTRYVSILQCPTCNYKVKYVNNVRTVLEDMLGTPFMLLTVKGPYGMRPAYSVNNIDVPADVLAKHMTNHMLYSPVMSMIVIVTMSPSISHIAEILPTTSEQVDIIKVYHNRSYRRVHASLINVLYELLLADESSSMYEHQQHDQQYNPHSYIANSAMSDIEIIGGDNTVDTSDKPVTSRSPETSETSKTTTNDDSYTTCINHFHEQYNKLHHHNYSRHKKESVPSHFTLESCTK